MKNIWAKLTHFVERFHKSKIFIAFLIIFTLAITLFDYEYLVKDSIAYPNTEYIEFETFARNHFETIKDGIIEDIPNNIDYDFEITKKNIKASYKATTEIPFFEYMSIDVSQYLANNEIELTRNYDEESYKSEIGFMWAIWGIISGIFVCFIFSLFCYIVRFINWIISKFSNKQRNTKEENIKKDLSIVEKASKCLSEKEND